MGCKVIGLGMLWKEGIGFAGKFYWLLCLGWRLNFATSMKFCFVVVKRSFAGLAKDRCRADRIRKGNAFVLS